jgi:S1-C subfamily serine protease
VYRLPVQYGAYVTSVTQGSPADLAGIQQDDIIIKIDDVAIDDQHPYMNVLFSHAPGDTITVTVARDTQTLTFKVKLEKGSN